VNVTSQIVSSPFNEFKLVIVQDQLGIRYDYETNMNMYSVILTNREINTIPYAMK
jgi:hypothetical protein